MNNLKDFSLKHFDSVLNITKEENNLKGEFYGTYKFTFDFIPTSQDKQEVRKQTYNYVCDLIEAIIKSNVNIDKGE